MQWRYNLDAATGGLVAIAEGQKAGRRRGGKRPPSVSTPADVGTVLRDAREAGGVTMAEVHDRTGVSWKHLEALENGDLASFSDLRVALVYLGRYAELFSLDVAALSAVIEEHWPEGVLAGALQSSAGSPASAPYPAATSAQGHLSRFPTDDASHLLGFTQTAQVPGVRSAAGATFYPPVAGEYAPIRYPARPAPLGLRIAVWFTAVLVAIGALGLVVHHYEPQWLADVHVVTSSSPPPTTPTTLSPTTTAPPVTIPAVTETTTTPGNIAVDVNADQYAVIVTPTGPVWVLVNVPGTAKPVFEGVLNAGQTKTFAGGDGPLSMNLGSSKVSVAVQINGKSATAWSFAPMTAPVTLNFSTNSSTVPTGGT